jgi:hypothetical protein
LPNCEKLSASATAFSKISVFIIWSIGLSHQPYGGLFCYAVGDTCWIVCGWGFLHNKYHYYAYISFLIHIIFNSTRW